MLLNKVWDLGLLEIQLVRTNHKSESGFGGSTVLVGWCGQEVSFNTTVDEGLATAHWLDA